MTGTQIHQALKRLAHHRLISKRSQRNTMQLSISERGRQSLTAADHP